MRALCGPDYRSVVSAGVCPEGLGKAERDCGYFFTGEIAALAQWQFGENVAQRIDQPVRLVTGGASPPTTHNMARYMAAMLPHATTTTIPGQDHPFPLRAPADRADLADLADLIS